MRCGKILRDGDDAEPWIAIVMMETQVEVVVMLIWDW